MSYNIDLQTMKVYRYEIDSGTEETGSGISIIDMKIWKCLLGM